MNLRISEPAIIVSLLKDSVKPTFFLGAGASKQSGVKLVVEIVEEAAKWAYCKAKGMSMDDPRLTMSDWKKWLKSFSWYTEDYSELYPIIIEELLNPRQTRKDFFLNIISPDVPSSRGYEILCELMALSLVDTVLTGNFDDCLYHASVQIRRPPVLQCVRTPSDLSLFSYTPKYPQLIYLHGSVLHYTDQNLRQEIQNLNPELSSTLKPLLKDRPLVVVGYRGSEPSVMNNLFLDNLTFTNNFHQGIYWCLLRRDVDRIATDDSILPPLFKELAAKIGNNLQVIPIDGFDELMIKEIWGRMRADQIDLKKSVSPAFTTTPSSAPTFDTTLIGKNTIGPLEIAIIRERIRNYSERLGIKVYEEEWWLSQQMLRLKVAELISDQNYELTSSGILLFSSKTQQYIPNAFTTLKFKGPEKWLSQITSFSSGTENDHEDFSKGSIERKISGNIWTQLNEITDALTLINRPFRLKGETSEHVYPYPTLALKEIIVNSLVHRDYSIERPVAIEVHPTHIVFTSPGGLIEEVKRQLQSESMEEEIKKGKRGIKGYRNPVLADLFYGSGAMDKEGSGLSDVFKLVSINSATISFGPTADNKNFEVVIYRRTEDLDEQTGTASPLILNQSARFACNLFEILKAPEVIFVANTEVRRPNEIYGSLEKGAWLPPFVLRREKIWSFYNLREPENPLYEFLDSESICELSLDEFLAMPEGPREFVELLNDSFEEHLFSIGLRVDTKKKRAYFTKTLEGTAKEVTYQGRLKKATRTVAKPRANPTSNKIYYWEHKSFWYGFENVGGTWYMVLNPAYVFTLDGVKNLLKSERVNILSTKRASRDYNMSVHNDLTFWASYISQGKDDAFLFRSNNRKTNTLEVSKPSVPEFVCSSNLPTVVINDFSVSEEFTEPTYLVDIEDIDREIEQLAKKENKRK